MSDTLIEVEDVSKKFCRSLKRSLWYGLRDLGSEMVGHRHGGNGGLRPEEFWAVKDIDFKLERSECLGLIGPNGAGKTTLLRMLNGLIKPDQGKISVRGRMQALIALGAGFNPILTGRENIYINASVLGIPKAEIDRQFDAIVEFSGIPDFIDTPVQNYSSGMAVRLGFAVAAHLNPDILLVDEVLAVGDEGFQLKCLNKIGELKKNGTAIILVSHNMHTVATFSSSVLLLTRGEHQVFSDVARGVIEYKRLFTTGASDDVEKICSGTNSIEFKDLQTPPKQLDPGDDISITLAYMSKTEHEDVEIDLAILSSNEAGFHFQATNKTYNVKLDIPKGEGTLSLSIKGVKINNGANFGGNLEKGTRGIALLVENTDRVSRDAFCNRKRVL
jgi:ABC-type polysaccharide/polyol phosphate transport system ATPase subunit